MADLAVGQTGNHLPGGAVDEASVSAALARAQQARLGTENERTKAASARTDDVVAGAAVAGANRQDKTAQQAQAEPAYDTESGKGRTLERGGLER